MKENFVIEFEILKLDFEILLLKLTSIFWRTMSWYQTYPRRWWILFIHFIRELIITVAQLIWWGMDI